ncbi:glycosyltransferase [Gammaproteobacteria bacterium]|nr:glycosyltransferase [Gammaproteobacteria bacterium]
MNKVLVTVVVYNTSAEELSSVLDCFGYLREPCISEIVVFDNRGSEDIEALCRRTGVLYGCVNENVGFGAGHNKAAQLATRSYEYHLILNPDLYITAEAIRACVKYMSDKAGIKILSPKLLNMDGSLQEICRDFPTPFNMIQRIARRFFGLSTAKTLLHSDIPKMVPAIHGACLFVERAFYDSNSGFDERFFLYLEDIDLCRSAWRSGLVVYYPFASAVHLHKKESRINPRLAFIHMKSLLQFFLKWMASEDYSRLSADKVI